MNHGNHIKYNDVIRFRAGATALMKVKKMDTLCGYVTYHGPHLFGENISIADNSRCRAATKEETLLWERYRAIRNNYDENLQSNIDRTSSSSSCI